MDLGVLRLARRATDMLAMRGQGPITASFHEWEIPSLDPNILYLFCHGTTNLLTGNPNHGPREYRNPQNELPCLDVTTSMRMTRFKV